VSTAADAFAFVKAEGLGNDFLIVDARADDLGEHVASLQPRAAALCDRRTGVGGDGLLLVGRPTLPGSIATMRVLNADGSRPQMCGNGLRCVALWLAEGGAPRTFVVDTDAGPRRCTVTTGNPAEVDVDMGPAHSGRGGERPAADGHGLAQVSMGNPHAIAFVAGDPEALARRLGPGLERDPTFPEGTNVEFARIDGDVVTLWVWERGCGITAACGTGACATVAAAVAQGRLDAERPTRVRLPGGDLWITVPADPRRGVQMRGPARLVFRGQWPAV
jgi:diaminopimelate epimerase